MTKLSTRSKCLLIMQAIANNQAPTRLWVNDVFTNTASLVNRLERYGVISITRGERRATSYNLTDFGIGMYDALLAGQVDDTDALELWRSNPLIGVYALLTSGKSEQWKHPAEFLLLEVAMNREHEHSELVKDILLKWGSNVAKAVIKNNCLIDFSLYGGNPKLFQKVVLTDEELQLVETLQKRLHHFLGTTVTQREAIVFAIIQALGTV